MDVVTFLGLWGVLKENGADEGNDQEIGIGKESERGRDGRSSQAEIEELRRINVKLLKICSSIEAKQEQFS